jgi:MFS family permease
VRRAIWILLTGNTLAQIGIGFFFPILPLFIGRKGGNAVLVGIVTAVALVGAGATQYVGGSLSDRYGRRPVLVWSSAVYAAGFLAYLAPLPVEALIPLRFLHAGFAGLYLPASAALLSDLTPAAERGRAFGYLQSSNMVGLLIGPGIGGLVAGLRLELVFGAAAFVCTLATLFLLALPRVEERHEETKLQVLPPPGLVRTLLPVIGMGAAYNYLFGAYDTIWSLFMVYAGANVFQVGLSFALFALPVALLSGVAGQLSDRFGARPTVALTLATSGIFALGYVFVRNVPVLIGMGVVEGALTTGGQPALQAEVSRLAPQGQQGGTQGLYRTAMVAAQIVGALIGGFLFTLWPGWAFISMAAACGLSLLVVPVGRKRAVAAVQPARPLS